MSKRAGIKPECLDRPPTQAECSKLTRANRRQKPFNRYKEYLNAKLLQLPQTLNNLETEFIPQHSLSLTADWISRWVVMEYKYLLRVELAGVLSLALVCTNATVCST